MPRERVFLSYSHRDEAFLKELQIHLKPLEDRQLLTPWSDHRIHTSDDWHKEIQQALQETAVAVLLISPDFLASDYIRQHELPTLLRGREDGEIDLACLYVRDSVVNDDATTFEVTLSTGETLMVKLTKYQGLNSPGEVVAALLPAARDTVYRRAAAEIKALVTRRSPRALRPPADHRRELTVQLRWHGSNLTRTYLHPYGRIAQHRSTWQESLAGAMRDALFTTLFASQAQCDNVLRALFGTEPAPPTRYPVRVRLQTDAPPLADRPWAEMAWEGHLLRDYGWTFELIDGREGSTAPHFSDITLRAPCSVLMIAPSSAPDADLHHRALEERLKHAWPFYHEKPFRVRDWSALVELWQRRRPGIVYYYGPAESDDSTLTLLFDGVQEGTIDPRPLTELSQVWGTQLPQIMFCNIVGTPVAPGIAPGNLHLPLLVLQQSSDAREAHRSMLAWLHMLLEGDADTDPVWALHQCGLSTAVAWGAYSTWHTITVNEPPKDKLARLLLDRRLQRSLGHTAVHELVRDSTRRLCCVLAYGAEGNLVEMFVEQLYEHLRRHAREVVQIRRLPLPLPTPASFDISQLTFEVQRQLGLGDRKALGSALSKRKPRGPGSARPLLLLDWGVRGTTEENRLSFGGLEAWMTFCCQELAAQCPKDLRLLSCLALEIDPTRHALLEDAVKELRTEAGFRQRTFHFELLPPLDKVEAKDLADFLNQPGNTSCPDELLAAIPELLVMATSGRFRDAVELIEQAERTDWYELSDELKARMPQSAGILLQKDDLL